MTNFSKRSLIVPDTTDLSLINRGSTLPRQSIIQFLGTSARGHPNCNPTRWLAAVSPHTSCMFYTQFLQHSQRQKPALIWKKWPQKRELVQANKNGLCLNVHLYRSNYSCPEETKFLMRSTIWKLWSIFLLTASSQNPQNRNLFKGGNCLHVFFITQYCLWSLTIGKAKDKKQC